jgi:hypothetical protein
MPFKPLAPELVPLVHHIELAKAGWSLRLTEQLATAAACSSGQVTSVPDLRLKIESQYGVRTSEADVRRAVGTLTSRKILLEVEPGKFKISEAQRDVLARQQAETADLEKAAKAAFEQILAKYGVAAADAWDTFHHHCLSPLVTEVGARIYHVLSGERPTAEHQKHVDSYVEKYPAEQRGAMTSAVDEFIRSGPPGARGFILQHLHAHLLMIAASLPEATLAGLQTRLKSTTQLTLVIDTNVLFSLLDLHENPGNDPSRDLQSLTALLKGKLNIQLVVLPLTLDEAKRTLLYYKQKLSRLDVTPLLGRATLRTENWLSGITQRFLQAAGQGRPRLSVDAYFDPYLEDLLTIARSKGIELYNENTAKFGTRQDVVDDILAQQEREKSKGDHAKPYEATHHDVVLWHCVDDRRSAGSQGPLDATYWLVTLDFQLLGFDSFKHRSRASYVPVCIHPTVLVQLLQLWLPRDANVDAAMLNSLRPMLPHQFDTDAEEVTVKILASLSRYENVDDLGEDTVAEILMNQALRQRMRGEKDIERQTRLVRDAIIEEAEKAKQALKLAASEREKLQASLEDERSRRANLAEELKAAQSMSEQQERLTGASTKVASGLKERVESLEAQLDNSRESARVAARHLAQVRFASKAGATLFVGLVMFGAVGYSVAPSIGFHSLGSALGSAVAWVALWIQLTHWRGEKVEPVRDWPLHVSLGRWRLAMWTTAGAVVLGVASNRIYDALKTSFGW